MYNVKHEVLSVLEHGLKEPLVLVMSEIQENGLPPRGFRYKNPPIEEAICELRFAAGQNWDASFADKLRTQLDDEYSVEYGKDRTIRIGFDVLKGKPTNIRFNDTEEIQDLLATKGKNRVLGVGPHILSIRMRRPYQDSSGPEGGGWGEFERRISSALDAYWKVASPKGIDQIEMRYVNKITIPSRPVRVEDYIKCALLELENLPKTQSSYISRVEYLYEDNVRLMLSHGLLGVSPEKTDLLLDLDIFWQGADSAGKDDTLSTIQDLHGRERIAFEAVITNKARELFNAD